MNLLDDSVFTVRTSDGHEMCSLPRIYYLIQEDAVESFAKLQAHQKQAWHCFLVQLAAIATEGRPMPDSEDDWQEALSALTSREAWNLYTEDLSKPAFMQPPVPEMTLDSYTQIDVAADDIPSLAKNHGFKRTRIVKSEAEHWAYMLVNVQTSDTYAGGAGGYPKSSRGMEGRAFLTTTPSLRLGLWIKHDIERMHKHAQAVANKYGYDFSGSALLWIVPWGEPTSEESRVGPLSPDQLHPWYIDCCRRIRKGETWMITTADHMRVEEPPGSQTGDPWAPIDKNEDAVLRPRDDTFRYDNLSSLLFTGDYIRPPGFSEVDEGYIVFRAMPKDYTERTSIRERIIRFYSAVSDDPFETPDESQIAEEAKDRVEKAGEAESILDHVLLWLLKDFDAYEKNSGKERKRVRQLPERRRQINTLHAVIDERFFERLFEASVMDDHERWTFWETLLVDLLRDQARDAFELAARGRHWERLAQAQSVLDRRIKSTFTYANQVAEANERENTEENGVGQPDARAGADLR